MKVLALIAVSLSFSLAFADQPEKVTCKGESRVLSVSATRGSGVTANLVVVTRAGETRTDATYSEEGVWLSYVSDRAELHVMRGENVPPSMQRLGFVSVAGSQPENVTCEVQ